MTTKLVKVGCCGFAKNQVHYYSAFNLVEIQQTFYKLPTLETALKWRKEAPPDFEFSIKAWQLITHPASSPTYRRLGRPLPSAQIESYGFFRPTEEVMEAWKKTEEIAQALRARVVLFQTPASFIQCAQNIDNMRYFFKKVERSNFIFAWEPRGDWDDKAIADLCYELGLVHCVDPFVRAPVYGDIKYFRLHGGAGYKHRYTDEELNLLKAMVRDEDYVLFNNIHMYEDALRFKGLLIRTA